MKWACDTGKAFDESLVIGRQTQELSDLPNVAGYATLLDSRRLLWISTYSRRCDDVPELALSRLNLQSHPLLPLVIWTRQEFPTRPDRVLSISRCHVMGALHSLIQPHR
ncbi:hypothetical protein T08_3497 [Trichinella sp. T8]|nr:hypothetical protein T08_3497 [Trichinella sp. T8]